MTKSLLGKQPGAPPWLCRAVFLRETLWGGPFSSALALLPEFSCVRMALSAFPSLCERGGHGDPGFCPVVQGCWAARIATGLVAEAVFPVLGEMCGKKKQEPHLCISFSENILFFFLYSSIAPVPARMSAKPIPALRLSFSFSTRPENTMVTKMLSLSMGTTTLANPSWRAR